MAFRILEHLGELDLLKPGGTVVDPMMGTGRFLIAACANGFKAVGVELEPKFVAMCQANREYAGKKLGWLLDWEIVQGDARNLSGLLGERGLVAVSSPPFGNMEIVAGMQTVRADGISRYYDPKVGPNYGSTPGQIGNLPDRVILTSPPYGDMNMNTADSPAIKFLVTHYREKEGYRVGPNDSKLKQRDYGSAPGQIGALPDRPVIVTSPPYEDSDVQGARHMPVGYFDQVGGIGHTKTIPTALMGHGETYLSAMAQVYAECLAVADVLVVVVKNPTRNGKLRDLAGDTIRLLEATGWRINCVHQAMLFEETEQGHLFDSSRKQVRGRMSFFKRLAWQKGSPIADHEDIIYAVRRGSV